MSNAFEKVCRFIERHSMLDQSRVIVVAVSGGADSVALLDMLARLAPTVPCQLQVAHLNHNLRGEDSTADAEFVRALAERLSLPVIIESLDVKGKAEALGRSIEETARELRYSFLLAVAREAQADRIATGHTINDQAETFLMRLARGAGSRGLAAMRPVIKAHDFGQELRIGFSNLESSSVPHPLLLRPLLGVTRDEVEEYCRERGLEFCSDVSNESLDYTRNRVRHEVIAALKRVNPRIVEHISSAASLIASDQEALDLLARSLLDQARQVESVSSSAYNIAVFTGQPEALRRRMIIEAIARRRSSAGARRAEVEFKHVTAVEGLLGERMSGARIALPGNLEAWREFDRLVIKSCAPVKDSPGEKRDPARALSRATLSRATLSRGCTRIEAGGIEISLELGQPGHLLKASIDEARREASRRGQDWTVVVLDEQRLPDLLIVRRREPGERAHVCGQRKIKKLKNLMIDHKIPSSRRADWPVVATPDGRYIWSPGLPPAVEFAARDETETLAILRASGV